jgi:hypothetical protein
MLQPFPQPPAPPSRTMAAVPKRCGLLQRIAVPFLQEVELGKRPKLPKSIKRQSLNEMAAFVAGEAGQSEPQNVESQVWRPRQRCQRDCESHADAAVAAMCLARAYPKTCTS